MFQPLDDPSPLPAVYVAGAPPAPPTRPLAGDLDADVAIVGAGFAGLSAALHLAEAGRRPVLLEAREVGFGAAGRNFGQVVPYTTRPEWATLERLGAERGQRLIEAAASGPDLVFGLIDRHRIACAPVRKGMLVAAYSDAGRKVLARRAEYWRRRGAPTELLEGAAAAKLTGSRLYSAVLWEKRAGTINPLALARGLAAAAISAGARIHTATRVTSLEPAGGDWKIATSGGNVTAPTVILATDGYSDAAFPDVQRALIPLRAYQLVSRPLGDNARRMVLPGGQSLTDTRHLYSGVRLHADGRLHVSADGPMFEERGRPFLDKIAGRLADLYPDLGPVEWDHGWSGWVGMTADKFPRLHRLGPGLLTALGYSGRGIALATVLGRELGRHAAGTPEAELAIPFTPLEPIRLKPLARPLVGGLANYYRVLDALDGRRLVRSTA